MKSEGPDMGILGPALKAITLASHWPHPRAEMATLHRATALSTLALDFSVVMLALAKLDRNVQASQSSIPPLLYKRFSEAIFDAMMDLGVLECEHCAGGPTSRLGIAQHDHARLLCEACDQLFATCDNCKTDVLLSEAVTVESKERIELYHPMCAPQLAD